MKTITYSDYLGECNQNEELMIFTGRKNKNGKKERRPIKESRFNKLRDTVKTELETSTYSSKEEAKEDLENKIQQMGPITFFLLRIFIGWLIDKLLDNYFSSEGKFI